MSSGALSRDFIIPPFSVLSARSGEWQERKKQWLELGIDSGEGRKDNLISGYKNAMQKWKESNGGTGPVGSWASKSIFDPVLTELCYAWFCPPEGKVLDPFAGGSVRGLVASFMGRHYTGVDLRPEQVEANDAQADVIGIKPKPKWKAGDAVQLYKHVRGQFDFILTCPPYGDLEKYSQDPADLSNMPYDVFLGAFRAAMKQSAARLKQDRFAVVVVGDFRDRHGISRGFVKDTITACQDAGLKFYNDAILVTQAGSLPLRARGAFEAGRKLGKTHQNVLVFVKGDPKAATEAAGKVTGFDFK
ncbi:DNA methyltransferase [Flexibacterium corallicola]|uniref:DNA methyltransferase n=1 Tax=Flexibacterium corallicola TaxID=3037259 RepID=UPI00286F6F77|nr:DNA methyltransferase [Pseudovibrio sp. M1P-2-3]